MQRRSLAFAFVACALPSIGCAALLGIDDVTVASDAGDLLDATSSDAGQDGALVGDAPRESASFDAAGCDADPPTAEAGLVQCESVACDTQSPTPICCPAANPVKKCYGLDGGCIAQFFECDKKSDCAMTDLCCMHTLTPIVPGCPYTTNAVAGSRCETATECPPGETELCSAEDPCLGDAGATCRRLVASFTDDTATYTRSVGGCF